jgi:hypothetical protein
VQPHYFAEFVNGNGGNLCRINTRIYFSNNINAPAPVPSVGDPCRLVVSCKNPGSAQPGGIVGTGLVPVALGGDRTLRCIAGRVINALALALGGRTFQPREHVRVVNLVSWVTPQLSVARRLYSNSNFGTGVLDPMPNPLPGLWFAWGWEPWLDALRCPIIGRVRMLSSVRACYVIYSLQKQQSGSSGIPNMSDRVKHPLGLSDTDVVQVLANVI